MKTLIFTLFFLLSINHQAVIGQCTTNFLKNAGFDTPLQSNGNGNNLLGVNTWENWTMTGGPFNVIRVNGSGYSGGPDVAHNGSQYLDITNGAGTITQNFTLTCASNITFSGWFSSRENSGSYINWTSSIQIVNSSNIVVATSTTRNFTNLDGDGSADATWFQVTGSAVSLPPDTYTFRINLGDFGNFDDAFLCGNPGCVLPLSLLSFSGEKKSTGNILKWETAEEKNFQKFIIEKSKNGTDFSPIVEVYAQANNSSIKKYTYTDAIDINTTSIYRLRMIDNDGSFKLSNLMLLKGIIKDNSIDIYPNPVINNYALLSISSLSVDASALIEIINTEGQVVKKIAARLASGSQTIGIELKELSNGFYVVRLATKGNFYSARFLKQ